MSNFNGHFTGGLVVATVGTCAAVALNSNFNWHLQPRDFAYMWGSGVFFSLFPDIDIKSKPSKM